MWRIASKIISFIFHPLFALIYILGFLILLNPMLLAHFTPEGKVIFLVYFVVNTVLIPVIAIVLMKMLGLIASLQMETTRDRIGPMIVVFILYMWMFINFKKEPDIPLILVNIMLGTVLSTAIAFIINVVNKISLHMTGMGGLLAALVIIFFHQQTRLLILSLTTETAFSVHMVLVIIFVLILTGMVASSRLFLKAHRPVELLQGFILGFMAQFVAYWIIF
ncbi:MAG TPA: hypothetical protein DCX89_07390 [Saprospirales bacterium]|nr:hypothetical protein [Saprospirales bacterium]HAY71700.1 hypothetical protein [Saprospirales bacterium]